ncbi:MAG TPA: kelch repeat-containing protein [Kofleriaceae bacterium]|jgi:cysteine-rich repeat protein
MRSALALALVLGACVHTNTQDCGNDVVCREGTSCVAISYTRFDGSSAKGVECVTDEQHAKCAGQPDGVACDGGTCFSQACLPDVCGNGRTDASEACDDSNHTLGDGCSPTCELEMCGNGIVDPLGIRDGVLTSTEQCDDGNSLSHDDCSSTCQPEVPSWRRIPSPPIDRRFAAMATNASTNKAILFGGVNARAIGPLNLINELNPLAGSVFGETWELSATGWTRIDPILSPTPRGGHAMVYDGTRTLLIGGAQSNKTALSDVWELDAGTWKQLDSLPVEMGPRAAASVAYLPGQGVVVFGGYGDAETVKGDTWLLADNSHQWTQLYPESATGPQARMFATLTYDADTQRVILAGGTQSVQTPASLPTWQLGPNGWEMIPDGPTAWGATSAYDPVSKTVQVFGGKSKSNIVSDLWSWNGSTWELSTESTVARFGAAGGNEPLSGHLQVFGGLDPTDSTLKPTSHDVFWFDGKWHTRHIREVSPVLADQGYAFDTDRARTVVYGGLANDPPNKASQGVPSNVTFELVEHTWFQPELSTTLPGPDALVGPSLAYANFGGEGHTYMFGGGVGTVPTFVGTKDLWRLDLGASPQWTKMDLTGPAERMNAMMAFDAKRRRIVLFGGTSATVGGERLGDTWELDDSGWTLVATSGPTARQGAAVAYDPIRHVVLVWGGLADGATKTSSKIVDDLWEWNGATWTSHDDLTFKPPGRQGARFAWDAARRRMVLWGGDDNGTWEWDGTAWSFVPAFEIPAARTYAMFSPVADGNLAMHGGLVGNEQDVSGQLFELVRASQTPTTYTTCDSLVDEDHDGAMGCLDEDCWSYCDPQCPPGATDCDPARPICGDHRCDAPRENCGICPSDCECAYP